MAEFNRLRRTRTLERARTRPKASGNFITITKGGTIWYLLYGVTVLPIASYTLNERPQHQPLGYVNQVPPEPPLREFGASARPNSVVPQDLLPPTQITIPEIPQIPIADPLPNVLPDETLADAPAASVGLKAGDAGKLVVGTTPARIFVTEFPIKQVLVLAGSANVGTIWVKPTPDVAAESGFPLVAGSARLWTIDDLSDLYFVGTDSADVIYFAYER